MHKVRTARGDIVDFDELKVKQTLAQSPANIQVKAREQFVDQRLRRVSKRRAAILSQRMMTSEVEQVEQIEEVQDPITENEMSEFEVHLEGNEEAVESSDEKPTRTRMNRKNASQEQPE